MKPWTTLAHASTPDGTELLLRQHDDEFVIRADGYDLMSSRQHGSEEQLAAIAFGATPPMTVLVGGLGLGYTLRAALDGLAPGGRVVVAELIPEVIEWNRGPLAPLAGHPLDDRRVELVCDDVATVIRQAEEAYDAILLDVDNGPGSHSQRGNERLYSGSGLRALKRALRPGGRAAIWSSDPDDTIEKRLKAAGLRPETHIVRARTARQDAVDSRKRGPRHWIFMGTRN